MAEDLRGRLEILREIERVEALIQRARQSTALSEERANRYVEEQKKKVAELAKELKELNQKRLDSLASEERSLGSLGSIYNRLSYLERERITSMSGMVNMLPAQQEAISKIAEINSSIAQLGRDDVVQRAALTEQYNQQLDFLNSIGGVQQEILDNLIAQNEVANQYANLSTQQKDFLQKQLDVYDGIKDTIGGILETADLLVSTTGGKLGAALIGAGFAADALGQSVRSMGGFIGGAQLSSIGLGMVFENAEDTTKSLAKEFGGLKDVSFQTQLNANLMATNMGVTQSEAASLLGNFARLNDGSTETAANLAQSTKELAKQNGLVPSQIMADVAGSAKAFAEYGKEGGKNIATAAISAGKLGVSMDTLTNITDSLLDFETSINNELELGAMLGRNVNLNRARALAYEGQIGAAVKDTLRELGGIEEFNRMDIFQKRQAAATLGISVEELQKMAGNLDKLNDDGTMQLSTFESWSESLMAFASGPLGSTLKGMGSLVIAAGQFNNGLGSLGTSLGGVVKSIWTGAKGMVGWVFKSAVFLANMVKTAALSIFRGNFFKSAGDGLTSMVSASKNFFTSLKGGEGVTANLKKSISSIGDKVKSVFTKKTAESVVDTPKDTIANAQKTTTDGGKVKGGSEIGKSLKGLASGLKEMGNAKVLFGALNLIPTGLGFVAILPGIPGMALLSTLGQSVGVSLKTLATGLKQMGTPQVALGALNLAVAGTGFAIMTLGALGMGVVSLLGTSAGIGLKSLGVGLSTLGTPQVTLGALNLALVSAGFALMTMGAIGLAAVALGGAPAGAGLSALAAGLSAFGNPATAGFILMGIGLLALLGVALIPLTYALSLLTPIIEAFGNVVTNVMGGVATIITAMVPAIEAFGGVITAVFSGLSGLVTSVANGFVTLLNSISPEKVAGLFMLGPALISAAAGLGIFALALGAAAVGSFFGGGLLGDIGTLAEMAEPLSQTAMALTGIGAGIMSISTALTGIDEAKLDAIEDFSVTAAAMGAVQQIGASVTGVIEGIAGLFGGEGKKEEEDKQQILIDEIKGLRTDLNTGKIAVYMDGERVTSRVSKVVDRIGSNSYAVK